MPIHKTLKKTTVGLVTGAVLMTTFPLAAFADPSTQSEPPSSQSTPAEVREADHDILKVSGIDQTSLPLSEETSTGNIKVTNRLSKMTSAVAKAENKGEALKDSSLAPAEGDVPKDMGDAELSVMSKPMETIDFVATGVTWDADSSAEVVEASIRVRESDEWGDWNAMEIAPQGEGSDRTGTEPLITSGADAVQVRVFTEDGTSPENIEVSVIDPGTGTHDGKTAQGETLPSSNPASKLGTQNTTAALANAAPASSLKPKVITRAQWGANESWASPSSQNSELKAMFVHHTAGTNNYHNATQAYQQVRGIYDYHARSLKWGDIGYHFLIDKFGNVYEGRKGSIDSLPVGAQAGGFNTDAIGVSVMGNYDVVAPSNASVEAVTKVLAWKAHQYGLKANGTTVLTSRAAAGSSARYKYGTKVTVPVILEHKTTNATACPGRYFSAKMSGIRSNVAKRVAAAAPAVVAKTPAKGGYSLGKDMTTAKASWGAVNGVDRYQIMYRAVSHGSSENISQKPWIAGKTTTATSIDLSADPGETAQFAVRSVAGSQVSEQRYLGQHTGALSNAQITVSNKATSGASASGANGNVYYMGGKGATLSANGASKAKQLILGSTSAAKNSRVEILRNNKYVGTFNFNGAQLCLVNLGGSGDNIKVRTLDNNPLTLTTVAYAQAGQTSNPASANGKANCESNFIDNPAGSSYFEAVDWMQWNNMSTGYTDGSFKKAQSITRGESLALIHRYYGTPTTQSAPLFKDVNKGGSFYGAISWGSSEGITSGYADGNFRPGQSVTRGEFAAFLYRAVDPEGYKAPAKSPFKDVKGNFHEAISWMRDSGMSVGYADGTYRPSQQITRAEVAQIIYRLDQK